MWNTEGEVRYLVLVMSLVTGQGTPGRQDFRRMYGIAVRLLVIVEMQGIGQMGHRRVQEEKL